MTHERKTIPMLLGDYTDVLPCEDCAGSGTQTEVVYARGEVEQEHDVPCYSCHGEAHVVHVVCGRCGDEDIASPHAYVADHKTCALCGHDAPHYLWLLMVEQPDHKIPA